eukprot:COSAG06_NODE_67764_length_251_cov_0.671053_2_plen_34_part_01
MSAQRFLHLLLTAEKQRPESQPGRPGAVHRQQTA